jgi:subtilisin family serine protease
VAQEVDIIVISASFPQKGSGYEEVHSAIQRAFIERVLIFAAASCGGDDNDRAYPAREEKVCCIHSTDANGTWSQFNSKAAEFEYNFATIGEAVESYWPTSHCAQGEQAVRTKSGTSIATHIAASIAAFLLPYARVYLGSEQAERLKQYTVMESLFRELSRTIRIHDIEHYLSLSLHPGTLFGRSQEAINKTFQEVADISTKATHEPEVSQPSGLSSSSKKPNNKPDYFILPTWDTPPNGPIALGSVITSIKEPHRPLALCPPSEEIASFVSMSKETDATSDDFYALTESLRELLRSVNTGTNPEKRSVPYA